MKRSFVKKLFSVLIIAAFVMFLFGLAFLTVRNYLNGASVSYYENRQLADFPESDAESILDGTFFGGVEDFLRDRSAKREGVLSYSALIDMMLKRPVVNDIVIAGDKLLPYNKPEIYDEASIAAEVDDFSEKLRSHSELCSSYGGSFCFIAIPSQGFLYADYYPDYLNSRREYTEKAAEALFASLDEKGVSYIDMLPYFEGSEYISRIDHHFTMDGALKTYSVFTDRLISDCGLHIPVLTEDGYRVEALENPNIGSRSRKLMGRWPSDEKITLIYPNEDIPYIRDDWFSSSNGCGSVYYLPETPEEYVSYSIYMGGDISFTKLSTGREELPSILIYGSSFTNAFESIAWYSFDTMYSLDFRYYNDMTLEEFIGEYQPDVVVCILDYSAFTSDDVNKQ